MQHHDCVCLSVLLTDKATGNFRKLLQRVRMLSCYKCCEGNYLKGRKIPCQYGWEENCLKSLPLFVSVIHVATVKTAFQRLH